MLADLEPYSTETLAKGIEGLDKAIWTSTAAWLAGDSPAGEIAVIYFPLRERFAAELMSRGVTVESLID